jgi:hypothetical protein
MRVIPGSALVVTLLVLGSGCSKTTSTIQSPSSSPSASASPSSAPPMDRGRVDATIDRMVDATGLLIHMHGTSLGDAVAQYQLVVDDVSSAVNQLHAAPAGVPSDVTLAVSEPLDQWLSALRSLVTCFQSANPFESRPCSVISDQATQRATTAGTALVKLIPSGTRSRQDVLALFGG